MEAKIERFFEDLKYGLGSMQVSDGSGESLGLLVGMRRAIDLIATQTTQGRKVMFIGNGASAAISSHQSLDYWKTGGMRAMAFNDPVALTCISNDFGYPFVFEKPIEMFADAGDVLVAISSSGRSENILMGSRAARGKGCHILTMSGFDEANPLRRLGDINFYVPSKSYGHVEVLHLALSHCILDVIGNIYRSTTRKMSG